MRLGTVAPLLLVGCTGAYDDILALKGDLGSGEALYEESCQSCHGADGEGLSGPALTERVPLLTSEEILQQIELGGGGMPAFNGQFDNQELANLLEYLTQSFR